MRNTLNKFFPGFSSLALAGLLATGCETVTFGEDPDPAPTDTSAGLASLRLANNRETDESAVVLHLFRSTAQFIDDAVPVRSLAAVDFGDEATFQVPAGRWKIGYETEAGDMRHMPAADDEGITDDWPVVALVKGQAYRLEFKTVENHTVWSHNLPVE